MKEVKYELKETMMKFGKDMINPLHIVSINPLEDNYSEVLVDSSLVRNPNIMKKYKVKVSSNALRKDEQIAIGNCGAKYAEIFKEMFGIK